MPEPLFSCKRGLRQGDPLSPYLFLLVADVLQQLIKQSGAVHQPAEPSLPCPVIQYADDTLLLVRAHAHDVTNLKNLLDSFAAATGLKINYNKSTMAPMHVSAGLTEELIQILGCKQGAFPQTYLGLPLSNTKLPLSAFAPLICKSDKYLSGWQATLLNPMGRTVLVNSVLDSQLVHAMSGLLLPQGVLDVLDARRRSFLWAGDEKVSGAQCLIAWGKACQQKEHGGLGIKDLAMQNKCLLLKLLHRLQTPGDSVWGQWVRAKINLVMMDGEVVGAHWRDLASLLPMYQAVTTCEVRDGLSTAFWEDRWLSMGTLKDLFPLLYTHATTKDITVAMAVEGGLERYLVPRLTARAAAELEQLRQILTRVRLRPGDDRRSSPLCDAGGVLRAGPAYQLSMVAAGAPPCDFHAFVWGNRAPPKVQFFAWLLVQERIQCRANLLKKNVVQDATCEVCRAGVEDCDHLLFRCPFSSSVWTSLHVDTAGCSVRHLWCVPRPDAVPEKYYNCFILLICWQLWKHRNGVIFQSLDPSLTRFWADCIEEAKLWPSRWPRADRCVVEAWCQSLSPM